MSFIIKHPKTGTEFLVDTRYILDNQNHGPRRTNPRSRLFIVVHHTAGNTAGDLKVLRGKTDRKVSVKFLVSDPRDGDYHDAAGRLIIWQLLPDDVIGWSVGQTSGENSYVTNSNSDSIEISNLGTGADVFEAEQVEAVEALIAYEEKRLGANVRTFGHREIAPGRKIDPHRNFPLESVKDFTKWVTPSTEYEEEDMAAQNKVIIGFVRPEKVAEAIAALAALGIRAYEADADTARITRENPKGTPQ